jgi:dTDP-4-amino-4,6-dideoxygalactose transaminase
MAEPVIDVHPPLGPSVARRPRLRCLPFPLEDPRTRIYRQARQGLWWGLKGLGLGSGDEVLAPAYHHGSEIEVLARTGARCRFYDVGATFEPDESELDALLTDDVRALYLVHPFGFAAASHRWRRWCDERGLLLLEDGAQAWLSTDDDEPVGLHADLALFCLYEAFGLPDGGAVCSRAFAGPLPEAERTRAGAVVRLLASWAAQRSARAAAIVASVTADHDARELPEVDFALGAVDERPARATTLLLDRVVDLEAPRRRRAHFGFLARTLPDLRPPAFADLPAGSSPLVFPIQVDDKPAVVERLRRSGIAGTAVWRVPHPLLPVGECPGADELRERLVGLPVHHDLRPEDMVRIAGAVRSATSQATAPTAAVSS